MLCITVDAGDRRGRHPLRQGSQIIGAAPDADVRVTSPFVSAHHVRLRFDGRRVHVEDAGSRNGTWLGDRRITAVELEPPFRLSLGPGATILVAEVPTDEILLSPAVLPSPAPAAKAGAVVTADALTTSPTGGEAIAPILLRALADDPTAGLATVLEALRSATGARAAAVLDVGTTEPVVIGVAGVVPREVAQRLPPWSAAGPRVGDGWVTLPLGSESRMALLVQPRILPGDLEAASDALRMALALGHRSSPPAGRAVARPTPTLALVDENGVALSPSRSPVMREIHARMAGALSSNLPVLLLGPTGAGKEVYARSIHAGSTRSDGPFHAVNASAIPETLLEAVLFGVAEGTATGVKGQPGLLRLCDGGTFFLDEVGEMPLALQSKLLRALDERAVLPVGAATPVRIDVRIVAATNRDLAQEVDAGRFRLDLYHRLRGHELRIPALRERAEDVPELVARFLADECGRVGTAVPGVTLRAMRLLQEHDWPGNVRELSTTVRRMVHEMRHDTTITHEDLPDEIRARALPAPARGADLESQLDAVRRRILTETLQAVRGNRSLAAERLGLSRGGLRALLRRLNVDDV